MAGSSILMAGGGTGGHVMPLLAVAEELRRRGHRPHFIGTQRGFEAKLVPARGFALDFIEISGFQGVGLGAKLRLFWQLPKAVAASWAIMRRESARACFSLGGYVAAPPVAATVGRGLPLVVMEPNAMPGLVNRMFGRYARKALLGFEAARRYFPAGAAEISGLPVREEFFAIPPSPRGAVFQVLVSGGSQGSQTLNRAVQQMWPLLAESKLRVKLVHQCGRREEERLREAFAQSGYAGAFDYELSAFLDDMPAAFAAADLVICRAGASTVGELMAAGRASILVPYPFAADDHQTRNAQAMLAEGAALFLPDRECTGEALFRRMIQLASPDGSLERMAAAARSLRRPGAAARAADILEEVAG
ncbi:MAG: undecaprenyldiphospho-muramoylpentapeptide beta-N-acetylglucosaminyltransferase [Bryobacter sp.]|nr:undecaprenyldiphospho-muramoylpentapeptide beta-N-acetylglucosaminyltransferase [Bryobacter sp.]